MVEILKILEQNLFDKNGDLIHHAFLISGPQKENLDYLNEILERREVISKDKKNLFKIETDKILIDDAKTIREEVALKPTENLAKIFIIKFSKINREAENALLKTFEEPPPETCFFLIVNNHNTLLPTTISRFNLIEAGFKKTEKKTLKKKQNLANQLKEIEKLAKNYKDKKIDLIDLDNFLTEIEKEIREKTNGKIKKEGLLKINNLRKILYGSSPNVKMILETATILKDLIL